MLTDKKEAQARAAYEPVQVKVTKVTPQGILCQSGGLESDFNSLYEGVTI